MKEKVLKKYIKPDMTIYQFEYEHTLLTGSNTGVCGGDSVQDEFLDTDVSYSRMTTFWGDDYD